MIVIPEGIVQVGLRVCRADRMINGAREQKSHRRRRF